MYWSYYYIHPAPVDRLSNNFLGIFMLPLLRQWKFLVLFATCYPIHLTVNVSSELVHSVNHYIAKKIDE